MIGGSAAVSTAKTDSALIEWLGELRGMVQRPPTEQEMTLARGALTGALPAQIETDDLVANRVMSHAAERRPARFLQFVWESNRGGNAGERERCRRRSTSIRPVW